MILMSSKRVLLAVAVCTSLFATGCTSNQSQPPAQTSPPATLQVVASLYPLQWVAEQVAGDRATVRNVTPPGAEPHDLELTPAEVAEVGSADLVIYIPGIQPAMDATVDQEAQDSSLNALNGVTLLDQDSSVDPHVWLNPLNMKVMAASVAERLANLDPESAKYFNANVTKVNSEIDALNGEFLSALKDCKDKTLVVSHEAFGYLADAYGFTQLGISGLSPDSEPSPARLREVAGIVRAQGVDTIYYETLVDPGVAKTLAAETGAEVRVLDPIEGLANGTSDNYLIVMRRNLATLVEGQQCRTS